MTLIHSTDTHSQTDAKLTGIDRTSRDRTLTISIIRTDEDFDALEPEWNELLKIARVRIYQSFEWHRLWWKYFGRSGKRSLHIMIFRDNAGNLAGILPLFLETEGVARVIVRRSLQFIGTGTAFVRTGGLQLDDGPSDYCDAIVHPEFIVDVADEFVSWLKLNPGSIDTFSGVEIPDESEFLNAVTMRLEKEGMNFRLSDGDRCSLIRITGHLPEYMAGLSPGVRRRLSQADKAVQPGGPLAFTRLQSDEEVHRGFQSLADLHQKRWNSLGYQGLFWDPRSRKFQEESILAFFRRGWLWFASASSGGMQVASRCAFVFKNRYYDYLTGFDDQSPAARFRPGLGLLVRMIDDAARHNAEGVDLLRGDEAYKAELTSSFSINRNIVVNLFPPGGRLRKICGRAMPTLRFLGFTLRKEWNLFKVQVHVHGIPGCIPRYLRFRINRIRRKVRSADRPNIIVGKE